MVIPLVAIAVVGAALSAAASIRQGQMAAKSAEFSARQQQAQAEQNALMSEREAQVSEQDRVAEEQALAFDVATRRKQFQRRFGERRAQVGASGLDFSGSSLLVAIDEAREAELDIEAMKMESSNRQRGLEDEAALQRFQAEEFRRSGRTALGIGRTRARIARTEGYLGAAGAVVGGAARVGRTLSERGAA